MTKVVVESIVKINIIIDNLNDISLKHERSITEVKTIVDRNNEIEPLLLQLNFLLDKALIKLKS